jgi:hypothetical protein
VGLAPLRLLRPPGRLTMALYRKKPVVVEAVRWDGGNCDEVFAFLGMPHPDDELDHSQIHIPTLEGTMTASPGDWLIRGVKGEFYPCKPDIFAATYELVSDAPSDEDRIRDAMTEAHNHPGRTITR